MQSQTQPLYKFNHYKKKYYRLQLIFDWFEDSERVYCMLNRLAYPGEMGLIVKLFKSMEEYIPLLVLIIPYLQLITSNSCP